jgi:hypothetical protein
MNFTFWKSVKDARINGTYYSANLQFAVVEKNVRCQVNDQSNVNGDLRGVLLARPRDLT